MNPSSSRRATLLVAAFNLSVDAVTAEVLAALHERDIEAILLKGPTIGQLLTGRVGRGYVDTDLLVPPQQLEAAERVLRERNFSIPLSAEDQIDKVRPPGRHWIRSSDGANVDLHETLPGVGVPPAQAWALLSGATRTRRVGGTEVRVLGPAAAVLHLALHGAWHGLREQKPRDDVGSAVREVDEDVWRAATSLARQLHAEPAFVAGLQLVPGGSALARELGLDLVSPGIEVAARAGRRGALAFARLQEAVGPRAKLRVLGSRLAPSPAYMRLHFPIARRHLPGLLAAYVWRVLTVTRDVVPAWRNWRALRRSAGEAVTGEPPGKRPASGR